MGYKDTRPDIEEALILLVVIVPVEISDEDMYVDVVEPNELDVADITVDVIYGEDMKVPDIDVPEIDEPYSVLDKKSGPWNDDVPLKIFVPKEEPSAKIAFIVSPEPIAIVPYCIFGYKDTSAEIEGEFMFLVVRVLVDIKDEEIKGETVELNEASFAEIYDDEIEVEDINESDK